mmetsp:Transcript_75567/g.196561  ORF Transcript_75567/g.196561 Transcript_75567/m.196561 type:complete len:291 (-) Transcript_75567:103-975(-)
MASGAPLMQMPEQQVMAPQALLAQPTIPVPADPTVGTITSGPGLSQALFCVCCINPMSCLGCFTKVDQNEQKALLFWGKYHGTLSEPGIYCVNPCGRELRSMSTKYNTLELKDIKVVDAKGSPVVVSGVVTYAIVSAKKACIDVENPQNYLRLQSTAALKHVTGRYPYSSSDGRGSLQTEGPAISAELVGILQEKVTIAGIRVVNFEIVDLSYAAEVAQVMLVKQQAEALVEARRLIVSSAVDMAHQAVVQLEAQGSRLCEEARERVTTNLLAVICSHAPATPTVPMSSR